MLNEKIIKPVYPKSYMAILEDEFFLLTEIDPRDSLKSAIFLTALLVLFVPIIAIVTPVSTLVLVCVAGGIYAFYLYRFDQFSGGLGSALFVLMTFNANLPLVTLTEKVHLSLYLADLVLVPLLAALLFQHIGSGARLTRINRAILGLATIFVSWTILAGFFGAGPSTIAGLLFSVEQLRYLLVLLVTVLYVKYNDYRCAIYPLAVALVGHSAFAFAQAYNGSIFGLSRLGEATPRLIGSMTIGPIVYQSGLHTGGFIGTSRVLAGVLLLCVPMFLVFMYESRFSSLSTGIGLSVFGILILMSNSDAGWGAFVLELVVFAAVLYAVENAGDRIGTANVPGLALAVVAYNFTLREWDTLVNRLFSSKSTDGSSAEPATPVPWVNAPGESVTSTPANTSSTPGTNSTVDRPRSETPAPESSTPDGGSALIDTSTLGIRLTQYHSAIEIGLQYPLFGLGGYNFSLIAIAQGLPEMISIHNIFLAYLTAAGIPGLFAFLTTIGLIVSAIARHGLSEVGLERRVAIALLSGLTGFLAMAFWTTLNNSTPAMSAMWAVCGIGLGLVDSSESVV